MVICFFCSMCQNIPVFGLQVACIKYILKLPTLHFWQNRYCFPFVLHYQRKFNLFLSTKWLFAQLMHKNTHTHTGAHFFFFFSFFPQFPAQTRAIQSSLDFQDCCCDRLWIFCSPSTHHISGRVVACCRPMSLTVPASANRGQHGPWHTPLGAVTMT